MNVTFFQSLDIKNDLELLMSKLRVLGGAEAKVRNARLNEVIAIILSNSHQFDEQCQVNISWIGNHLQSLLSKIVSGETTQELVDDFLGSLYRFIVEFDLSTKNDLSMELRRFQTYVLENHDKFSQSVRQDIDFARQEMPIAITKHLLGSDVLQNIQSLEKYSQKIGAQVTDWDKKLALQEGAAKQLEDSLRQYKTGFNFVGLHQGFDDLSKTKVNEINSLRKWLVIFGLFALLPLMIELVIFYCNVDRLEELKWGLVAGAIPALSFTVLLIYFFKIVLRNSEAARSQLLQIELRKTLCRFIQSYGDYSEKLKKSNADALSKFENVIFSGIVSSDEKLPSTFDGLEQLTNMVKAMKA